VVEAFLASDPEHPTCDAAFEVAPTKGKLDLLPDLPRRDLAWHSGLETATRVDRRDRARQAFPAWKPPLTGTFHPPERIGALRFIEQAASRQPHAPAGQATAGAVGRQTPRLGEAGWRRRPSGAGEGRGGAAGGPITGTLRTPGP